MRHGDPLPATVSDAVDALLAYDPELRLVVADMDAWADAHPCECPTLCECDDGDPKVAP